MIEAMVPARLINTNVHQPQALNVLDFDLLYIYGEEFKRWQYTTHAGPSAARVKSLLPTLTTSMGRTNLDHPRFGLLPEAMDIRMDWTIYYQIHIRNYETARESVSVQKVERV